MIIVVITKVNIYIVVITIVVGVIIIYIYIYIDILLSFIGCKPICYEDFCYPQLSSEKSCKKCNVVSFK